MKIDLQDKKYFDYEIRTCIKSGKINFKFSIFSFSDEEFVNELCSIFDACIDLVDLEISHSKGFVKDNFLPASYVFESNFKCTFELESHFMEIIRCKQ